MMASGSGFGGFLLRVALLGLVPAGVAILGVAPSLPVALTSVVACLFEGLNFAVSSDGGRKVGIRPQKLFPIQLAFLYLFQIWWQMIHTMSEGTLMQAPAKQAVEQAAAFLEVAKTTTEAHVYSEAEPEFLVDAPMETLAWHPKTISVVLPCAEERLYAFKTVQSVFENTPGDVLHEIVVVDDGSEPPLSATHLTPEVQEKYKILIKRHENTVGLIGAKQTGGDAATGDIVVFFDCHVAPQPGWYKEFLTLSAENYRRMVVPVITALDVDTWTQISDGGTAKCYLTWDADFKWLDSFDNYIPVISGGLLAMSNRWWQETGGYDVEMLGWGGENLDQSLRVWLCGGEIVMAANSRVAHMWRDGKRADTHARYKRVGNTNRNKARAVHGWYGEFSEKLAHYPGLHTEHQNPGELPWYGDLKTFDDVKKRLGGCRPFAWFLRRFKSIYEDGGIIPAEIFMLKDEETGQCLLFQGHAGTSGVGREGVVLANCEEGNHRFYWHLGNADRRTHTCCSGLRAWNTDQCLAGGQGGNKGVTGICNMAGGDVRQEWALIDGKLRQSHSCLGSRGPGVLEEADCNTFHGRWSKVASYEPLETTLYNRALRDRPEIFNSLK
eukprot:CAMPEP_0170576806 /NCGR_PEP_ID=MMETSP0224-20130122/4587_1 /TAXON_ID=285029 /ORGANISM="Togula jolla, Strain CCCM 725" /LENGTH=609 /DNA_ID=CAMNT_0010899669 /DNA_START=1 /DNA_END=1831 /DNA_ORIENTATION=-